MADKRIIELDSKDAIAVDDYVPVDGQTGGTKKFLASQLGGKAEVMTEAEWEDLPSDKYTDNKVYVLTDAEPPESQLFAKVGSASLDTSADNLSDAINEHESDITTLNSNKALTQKIYRFLFSGDVSAGGSFAFTSDYTSDNNVYVDTNDNTKIKFARSGIVRVSVHLAASPASGATNKRVWVRLQQGTTVVASMIQYGEYTSQSVERLMSVSSTVSVSVSAAEAARLNIGGTGPSYIEVQWIS